MNEFVTYARSRVGSFFHLCGISAEVKAAEDAAPGAMDTLVRSARKATAKQLLGRTMPLPFQQGILRSSASLLVLPLI